MASGAMRCDERASEARRSRSGLSGRAPARLFALVVLLLAGCGGSSGSDEPIPICTAETRPAIVARAIDSSSGAPLRLGSVTVASNDGRYSDTRTDADPPGTARAADGVLFALQLRGATATLDNRAGTFTVTLRAAGFTDFVKADVVVPGADCGPTRVVEFDAPMTRIAGSE